MVLQRLRRLGQELDVSADRGRCLKDSRLGFGVRSDSRWGDVDYVRDCRYEFLEIVEG